MNAKPLNLLSRSLPLLFLTLVPPLVQAADQQVADTPAITEKGPHHRNWQTVSQLEFDGQMIRKTNSFVEVQTGLYRYDTNAQDYLETDRRIELFQDGAVIRNLQYSVIFAPNLASQGAIDILLPDGQSRLTGQIMGLAFTEGERSVLIAETHDCAAEIIGPDQNFLVYRSAFTDFDIDVQFQAERANFSQTIIFKERIPDPTQYGLTENAHLELLSEWTTAPAIDTETFIWEPAHDGQHALTDQSISVAAGSMKFIMGKAFSLGEAGPPSIPIAKSWEVIDGRSFIIEKAPWRKIAPEFLKLPPRQANVTPRKDNNSLLASRAAAPPRSAGLPADATNFTAKASQPSRISALPAKKTAAKMIKPIRMAEATPLPTKGLAMDWDLGISTNSFTWQGGRTYYVSGLVSIDTNFFEGTVVVKFAPTNNATILVTKSLTCLSDRYTPIFLTARDDRSVGESIGSSALSGYYAANALSLAYNAGIPYTLHDIRISHAKNAFQFSGAYGHVASHIQLVHCETGLINTAADVSFRNLLAYSISNLCYGDATTTSTCRWENATFDQVNKFNDTTNCIHYLTNCLLVAVTNTGPYSGSYNASNSNPAAVFQTVGASAHYLLDGTYRNAGTTNVAILSDIQKLTTYPPIILQPTNDYMGNTNLVLFPQAMRDWDTPDLGAHLVPLDFIFGWAYLTNSNILLTNGVAIGTFSPVAGFAGMNISRDTTFISEGLPNALNHIVRYNICQEQANDWGTNRGLASIIATYQGGTPGSIRFRFTDWSVPAQDNDHLKGYTSGVFAPIDFVDCQFHGGTLTTGSPKFNVTNCLFERVGVNLNGDWPFDATFRSCTFYGGSWNIYQEEEAGTWTILDNIFDKTSITTSLIAITNDYNGYMTNSDRLPMNGSHDVVLAGSDAGYQTSWLGRFYLPTNSAFIDKSCVTNASQIGMYWHTTLTNQTRELTNRLDLGFHVVSTDSSGNPLDLDNDGFFDFPQEDLNGNGVVDSGETDPNSATDLGLRVQITNPKNNSNIP